MKYYFVCRVCDEKIDKQPGGLVVQGPFDTREEAKNRKQSLQRGMKNTDIFQADSYDIALKEVNENKHKFLHF